MHPQHAYATSPGYYYPDTNIGQVPQGTLEQYANPTPSPVFPQNQAAPVIPSLSLRPQPANPVADWGNPFRAPLPEGIPARTRPPVRQNLGPELDAEGRDEQSQTGKRSVDRGNSQRLHSGAGRDEGSQSDRAHSTQRDARATIDITLIKEMVRKGVAEKMAEMESRRAGAHPRPIGIKNGPLSPEIYEATMNEFKYPVLPSFQGNRDNQDMQNYVHGILKRLRLPGATDAITCCAFTTCLTGEAWEWYMGLPQGSIKTFDDLAKAFLA